MRGDAGGRRRRLDRRPVRRHPGGRAPAAAAGPAGRPRRAEVLERAAARWPRANSPASAAGGFLGAGVYDHYVPAVVDAIIGRSEFLDRLHAVPAGAQPGLLQAIFEFQTAICELTGLDVSNASLYDGGTALAEAALMAGAQTRRGERRGLGRRAPRVPAGAGHRDAPATGRGRGRSAARRRGGSPTWRRCAPPSTTDRRPSSCSSPTSSAASRTWPRPPQLAHDGRRLLVAVADPLSLGLLEPPGELRRRHRRRRGAGAGQRHELRRPAPRLHGRRARS